MNKIELVFIYFICSVSFSQIRLINKDTTNSKFYNFKEKNLKSFLYKKQYITSQTGEKLFVMYDSICVPKRQKKRLIYAEDDSRKYFYYKDSLIIRNWDMHDTPIKFKNYFELSIYLKSKNYKNIQISLQYNKKDSLSCRLVISKPDPLTFYTDEIYNDTHYNDTRLTENQKYKLDESYIYLNFNKKGFIEKLYYYMDSNKELFISFTQFVKPKEYGYYIYKKNLNQGRFGIWYTYYENGKLSSEGEYCGSEFDSKGNEIKSRKNGKWIYYTKQGCIEKEEYWESGKLVKQQFEGKS